MGSMNQMYPISRRFLQLFRSHKKNVTETSTDNEPKKTVGTLPTKKKAGTLWRSNRHQANKDEHTLEKTARMAQIRNLENSGNKSFISFSDSRISSNLDKLGISLGRDDNGIRCSTVAIKNIEMDRLVVSASHRSKNKNNTTKIVSPLPS
jgi:hypothetical protein